jgi:hypothetical protein
MLRVAATRAALYARDAADTETPVIVGAKKAVS